MLELDLSRALILQYSDGGYAVQLTNVDGSETLIEGFPGLIEAKDFLHFGDLDAEGLANDFVQIVQPSYPLIWSHDRVN